MHCLLRVNTILAGGLALAAAGALACGDWLPKHGGLMNQGGETSFELVARGLDVVVHLEDHGTPIPTAGARAMLQVEGAQQAWSATMEPTGENSLRAALPRMLAQGDRILAKVTLADGSVVGGRFVMPADGARQAAQDPAVAPPMPTFRFR